MLGCCLIGWMSSQHCLQIGIHLCCEGSCHESLQKAGPGALVKVPGQLHPVQQKKDLPSNLKTEVWRGQLLGKVSATSLEGRPDREAICGASWGAGYGS